MYRAIVTITTKDQTTYVINKDLISFDCSENFKDRQLSLNPGIIEQSATIKFYDRDNTFRNTCLLNTTKMFEGATVHVDLNYDDIVGLDRYVRFESDHDGNTVKLERYNPGAGEIDPFYMQYSMDGNEWSDYSLGQVITLNKSDVVYFRGYNKRMGINSNNHYRFVTYGTDGTMKVAGNIMSLLDYENPSKQISETNCFCCLFETCLCINDASELLLPATQLATGCYSYMFYGCTYLTSIPELPALNLATQCYMNMFSGCSSLNVLPELPATKLPSECYMEMFTFSGVGASATSTETEPWVTKVPTYNDAVATGTDCTYHMFDNFTPVPNTQFYTGGETKVAKGFSKSIRLGDYLLSSIDMQGDSNEVTIRCTDKTTILSDVKTTRYPVDNRTVADLIKMIFEDFLPSETYEYLDVETQIRCMNIMVTNSYFEVSNARDIIEQVCQVGMLNILYSNGTFKIGSCY